MKTLFIHRSVGNNLINDSRLYNRLYKSNAGQFADYDNNTGILRTISSSLKLGLSFPNNNTRPVDYALLFSELGAKEYSELYKLVMSYDRIIIKSCYPNSNIKNDQELQQIKDYYLRIKKHFTKTKKQLIIMTSPPLRPSSTSSENAARARKLANWLAGQKFGKNIGVFDFFDLLANKQNYLKREYRRLIWLDNHPNKRAAIEIAPKFIEVLEA
ncbi:hypothetical protein KC878_03265 [Candidatus Saccharibacteria bacterium]|nr:hypothetical protein [Candidatus Saccharibacteria bacterium]MCB9821640.1 hypothetical protein [Candidatus Nomurabacteria bacterium]